MIELTYGDKVIVVNPNNISTIIAYDGKSKVNMNDGSSVFVNEDILDIMKKIVDSRFGIAEEVQ